MLKNPRRRATRVGAHRLARTTLATFTISWVTLLPLSVRWRRRKSSAGVSATRGKNASRISFETVGSATGLQLLGKHFVLLNTIGFIVLPHVQVDCCLSLSMFLRAVVLAGLLNSQRVQLEP